MSTFVCARCGRSTEVIYTTPSGATCVCPKCADEDLPLAPPPPYGWTYRVEPVDHAAIQRERRLYDENAELRHQLKCLEARLAEVKRSESGAQRAMCWYRDLAGRALHYGLAECARLRDALDRYGEHRPDCDHWREAACSCDLDAALGKDDDAAR